MSSRSFRALAFPITLLLAACDPGASSSCGTWRWDADGDGHAGEYVTCQPPAQAVEGGSNGVADCDDADPTTHPGATDGLPSCDGLDQDCDGAADEDAAEASAWPDADGDGYGDASAQASTGCEIQASYADNALDCDDADPAVPAPELLDACGDDVDADCDGAEDACGLDGAVELSTLWAEGRAARFDGGAAVALGDLNGDGYDDFAVGDADLSSVVIVSGGASGLSSRTLAGDVDGAFGAALAAGDFDGDGQLDLAVGSPDAEAGLGEVAIYLGPSLSGAHVLAAPRDADSAGASLAVLPGASADGLAVALRLEQALTDGHIAGIYAVLEPLAADRVKGERLTRYDDGLSPPVLQADPTGAWLAVGVLSAPESSPGLIDLYSLPLADGAEPVATVSESSRDEPYAYGGALHLAQDEAGATLLFAGDGAHESAYAWSISGATTLSAATALLTWTGPFASELGTSVRLVGDLSGDGRDELAIGGEGTLWIITATADGLPQGDVSVAASGQVSGFDDGVWELVAAGDVNGDGYGDLLALDTEAVWLLYGGPRG